MEPVHSVHSCGTGPGDMIGGYRQEACESTQTWKAQSGVDKS